MRYVYWVTPGVLAGRPGPDEFSRDLSKLYDGGFRAILSLHDGGVDSDDIRQRGFAHKLLSLPCSVPPATKDILVYERLLPEALAFIGECMMRQLPTLAHCHASKDRTGVVLACYLSIYMDLIPAEAIAKLRSVKPSALSAEGYEALVYRLLDSKRDNTRPD